MTPAGDVCKDTERGKSSVNVLTGPLGTITDRRIIWEVEKGYFSEKERKSRKRSGERDKQLLYYKGEIAIWCGEKKGDRMAV